MKYLEDLQVGETFALGSHMFTADDIKAFARRFDPQPFHLDEAAGAASHFGGLCASGWHTATMWMRLMVAFARRLEEQARLRGETAPSLGPALGLRDLNWQKPVYAGDTIDYSSEVLEKRVSNSRAGFGLLTLRSSGVNQNGEMVMSFFSTAFVARRPEAA